MKRDGHISEESAKRMKLVFPGYVKFSVKRDKTHGTQSILIAFVDLKKEQREAKILSFGGILADTFGSPYTALAVEPIHTLDELNARCDHWHKLWCEM